VSVSIAVDIISCLLIFYQYDIIVSGYNMHCTAFEGSRLIASGDLAEVTRAVKEVLARGERAPVLVFDNETSRVVDLDLREPEAQAAAAEPEPEKRPVGRPKLGVVPKEVTLLPRHWEWLGRQPGGASVTLRRLVDEARNVSAEKDRLRQAQESAYRFMSAMAGNEPGFEEALRALFAGHKVRFENLVRDWPIDVRDHALLLAGQAFK